MRTRYRICFIWVQLLIYILPWSLEWYMIPLYGMVSQQYNIVYAILSVQEKQQILADGIPKLVRWNLYKYVSLATCLKKVVINIGVAWQMILPAEPRFNIKMSFYQYRKSHCGDKMILWQSFLHNGISYTGKRASLYCIRALEVRMLAANTIAQNGSSATITLSCWFWCTQINIPHVYTPLPPFKQTMMSYIGR